MDDRPRLSHVMKAGAFSLPRIAALMPPVFGRTHASTMPAGFDAAFAKVKELVADFRANEKFVENSAKLFVKV